jgi:uncharacterized repeat protein (TIGR01451 family)
VGDFRATRAASWARGVLAASVAIVVGAGFALAGAPAAQATNNFTNSRLAVDQTFYIYVQAGELPYYNFAQVSTDTNQAADFTITDPLGTVQQSCHFNAGSPNGSTCIASGLTSVPGIWAVRYEDNEVVFANTTWRWNWEVEARSAANAEIAGRAWVEQYGQYQADARHQSFWIATREGYLYQTDFRAYNGLGSYLAANGFGLVDAGTCTPIYKSVEGTVGGANGVFIDPRYDYSDECGDAYKIFLDLPASDLPAEAASATGTEWIRPAVIAPSATNLALIATSPFTRAGDIEFDLAGVNGGYTVQIDADGNGSFDDPVDRTIPWGSPPGHIVVPFDGLDGLGQPLDVCEPMTTRVVVDRVGEMHLVLQDVEQLGNASGYGLRITGLTPGVVAPNPKVYWDDRELAPRAGQAPLPYADGRAGVDTSTLAATAGTHGWTAPWGDVRSIENWTFYEAQAGDETLIDATCQPGLSIDKESVLDDTNSNGVADVGETISYTFLVRNTGNTPLEDVTVDDSRVSGVAPAPVSLPVFGEQLFTADPYIVTQGDVDAGGITNVATAIGLDQDQNLVTSAEDTEFVPTTPRQPALTLDKTAELNDTNNNGVADLGETIDYTFAVENTGNVTLTDVTVVDDRVTGLSASVTLAPGETHVFTADPYVVVQSDLNTGVVHNTASATGVSALGPVASDPDSAQVPTPDPDPELTLVKTGEITTDVNANGLADVGDTISYTFVATNTGTVDLTNVTIDDPKVGAISPASAAIGANSNATFAATYVVTQADVDSGAVRNTATASGTYTPPDADPVTVVSGPDDENIPTPLLDPSLTIEKDGTLDDTNNNGVADAGETITYEFLVTNTGNTTLLGVNVVDDRVAGIVPASVDLIPGGTQNFQSTPYLVTQADVDAGEVANTAFARGQVPNGPEVFSPEDEHLEPVVGADPSLTLAKSAELQDLNGNGTADAGESVIYTFGVQNTGNVTVFDVVIDDPMLAGLLPDPIDFLPPAAITFVVADPYVVTAEDVAAGEIANVATAAGVAPDESPVVSEEDEVVVTATPPATGSAGLPSTGRDVGPLWAAAVALMLVGAVALAIARRRVAYLPRRRAIGR